MTPRPLRPDRSALLAIVLVLATLASTATAQVDDRARALLEGLQPTEAEVIETLDQTTVVTVEAQDATEVRSRTVVDYVGQRARVDTEVGPGMAATVLIVDGTLSMNVGGMRLPLPPELGEQFADIFETDPNDPLAGIDSATFDGPVAYGDLVSGDQVTVTGAAEVAGLDGSGVTRYVFANDGGLLAVASDGDDGATILMVFDQPLRGSPAIGRSAAMYELRGDQSQRVATIRYEDVRINEPIPDDMF